MKYKADCETDWPAETVVRSVNLQKVIMLPRIPGVKSTAFTKRIIAFHHQFAVVGKERPDKEKKRETRQEKKKMEKRDQTRNQFYGTRLAGRLGNRFLLSYRIIA